MNIAYWSSSRPAYYSLQSCTSSTQPGTSPIAVERQALEFSILYSTVYWCPSGHAPSSGKSWNSQRHRALKKWFLRYSKSSANNWFLFRQMTTKILAVDAFSQLIRKNRDLYEGCEQNGHYLPKLQSPMVTEDYMRHVMTGKSFCPKRVDIRMLLCTRPLNKD